MTVIIQKTTDPKLVEAFILHAGNSLAHFRYYDSRKYDVIFGHLVTYLLFVPNQDNAIAYGHLEFEDNRLWLGIAVSEKYKGNGYGTLLLRELIAAAKGRSYRHIFLSVDLDNKTAICLYEKFGFKLFESRNDRVQIMRLSLYE